MESMSGSCPQTHDESELQRGSVCQKLPSSGTAKTDGPTRKLIPYTGPGSDVSGVGAPVSAAAQGLCIHFIYLIFREGEDLKRALHPAQSPPWGSIPQP